MKLIRTFLMAFAACMLWTLFLFVAPVRAEDSPGQPDPMKLAVLLVSVGGIGIVVKLLVDVIKSIFTGISGRATQVIAFALSVGLALIGEAAYGHSGDWLQVVWVGIQAGAAAIGVDQLTKKAV